MSFTKKICLFLIVAFSVGHAVAQENVSFRSQKCLSKERFLDDCSWITVTGKLYRASSTSDTLVIVTHNSAGTDPRHYRYAEHINTFGYSALVIDHWKSRGIKDAQKDFAEASTRGGNAHNMVFDVNWAMIHFKELGFNKFGFIGESMGGSVAMLLAKREWQYHFSRITGRVPVSLSAIVGLYGNCNERYSYDKYLDIPTVMITGSNDENTPAKTCKDYIEEWAKPRGAKMTFIELPDQHHDFDADFSLRSFRDAENPAKCISTVDLRLITSVATGETYPNTPAGWAAWKNVCMQPGFKSKAKYGHTGNIRTGFNEWSRFLTTHLSK